MHAVAAVACLLCIRVFVAVVRYIESYEVTYDYERSLEGPQ
jgi:hypothetical protein